MPVAIHNGHPFTVSRGDRYRVHLHSTMPQHSAFAESVVRMDGDETDTPYLVGYAHLLANSPRLLQAAETVVSNYGDVIDDDVMGELRAAIAACRGEAITVIRPLTIPQP